MQDRLRGARAGRRFGGKLTYRIPKSSTRATCRRAASVSLRILRVCSIRQPHGSRATGCSRSPAQPKQPDDRITLTFQATPWFEASARYSIVYGFFGEDGPLYDRSLGFKARLWREGRYMPQLAVGFLDIGGTAIFGGEYVVASKRFGPIDATLGMGFGRLGSNGAFRNPLTFVSDRFKERDTSASIGETGQFDFKDFFSGEDVGLFGGVQVQTPVRGLNLIAEYSADDYVNESTIGFYEPVSPINVGISYAPNNSFELGLGWINGREVSMRLSTRINLKDPVEPFKLDPPPRETAIRDELALRDSLALQLGLSSENENPSNTELAVASSGGALEPPRTATVSVGARAKTIQQSTDSFFAGLDQQLAPINFRVRRNSVRGREAVIELERTAVRPPLDCREVWTSLRATALPDLDRVTVFEVGTGAEQMRCTRIVERGGARRAKSNYENPERGRPRSTQCL